jgi:hypothetical protein
LRDLQISEKGLQQDVAGENIPLEKDNEMKVRFVTESGEDLRKLLILRKSYNYRRNVKMLLELIFGKRIKGLNIKG